jgi:hypothetical protein
MADPMETPSISRYREMTERLEKLGMFLSAFAPAIGETASLDTAIEMPREIEKARDRAIVTAFEAFESLARETFPPKS